MQNNYGTEEIPKMPDVYYKLQPYIMMACDQIDTYGHQMPTQAMIEQMTNDIYQNFCQMHPDLAEHDQIYEEYENDDPAVPVYNGGYGGYGRYGRDGGYGGYGRYGRDGGYGRYGRERRRKRRRRSLLKDLIDILIYYELFRRRKRYC